MNAITAQNGVAFWTRSYGAFRWDKNLQARRAQWFLVSFCSEFDYLRGLASAHVACTVDDFGNLVAVPE